MHEARTALPLRSDTLFGVCQAIGEDFGFNPQLLRIGLALTMAWQPYVAVGTYFALGVVVLLSRLVFPAKARQASAPVVATPSVNYSEERRPELAEAA